MAGSVPKIWRSDGVKRFVKSFELTVEDHMAVRYARTEPLPFGRFAAFVVLCAVFVSLIFAYDSWKGGNRPLAIGIVAGSVVAGLIAAKLLYGFFRELFKGFWRGFLESREAINVPMEVTVDAGGLSVLVRQQTWFCPWDSLASVEEDEGRYYFWTSNMQTHVLPKHLFDEAERAEFDAALREWWGHAPVSPPRKAGVEHLNWAGTAAPSKAE